MEYILTFDVKSYSLTLRNPIVILSYNGDFNVEIISAVNEETIIQ